MRPARMAALAAAVLTPALAWAHPVDEVVQGAYLTLAPGEVKLELDLTAGPEVSAAVLDGVDPDQDQKITPAEADAFGRKVLALLGMTLDGAPAALTLRSVSAPPYANLAVGVDTVKIYATVHRPERPGSHVMTFQNNYRPAKSQCAANVFLQPGGGWRYRVESQAHGPDGRLLTVRYTAAR